MKNKHDILKTDRKWFAWGLGPGPGEALSNACVCVCVCVWIRWRRWCQLFKIGTLPRWCYYFIDTRALRASLRIRKITSNQNSDCIRQSGLCEVLSAHIRGLQARIYYTMLD